LTKRITALGSELRENDAVDNENQQWTEADFKSLAAVLGIESCSAAAVLEAISVLKDTAAAASENAAAAAAATAAATAAAAALRGKRDTAIGTAAAAVLEAVSALSESAPDAAAALQEEVTAATQPADELGSVVFAVRCTARPWEDAGRHITTRLR
jgi:hypothetical protein